MARKLFLLSVRLPRYMLRIIVLLLFILFCLLPDMLSGREVRVGIYENPPKVFLDD